MVANIELDLIDQAFKESNNQRGLELLREHVKKNPTDVGLQYRLACVEEQIGRAENAENAYGQCLKIAPKSMIIYLYSGYFFQQAGQLDKALALYSLGQDIDNKLVQLYRYENVAYETKLRSHAADVALREHFTALHNASLKSPKQGSIIHNAIWPQSHNKAFQYLHEQQKPHVFYLPDLRAEAVFDKKAQSWCAVVEESYLNIRSEFENITNLILQDGSPYLSQDYSIDGFESLSGSKNWTALHFFKNGVANELLIKLMPKTARLLKKIPLYHLNDNPYEVFFSLLKPGQHIKPHFGLSNHSLTVHLPIIVPGNGYLRVGDKKNVWCEGDLIIFDDSFEHEAINNSDDIRVVLIFSIWHPDLTELEQQEIKDCFNARSTWLEQRHDKLNS